MAPGRRRGGKGVKTKSELRLGDLVLAKVKGFPAWPAKVSRPEDWGRMPDPRKYFVQFFGTLEIAFVVPADIQPFTIESKNKLLARCQGKTVKFFAQAVNEISEEFEELQNKVSSGIRDDNNMQTVGSEGHSADGVVGESSEVNGNVGMDRKGPEVKLETKEPSVSLQKQDYVENQDDHRSTSPPLSLGKRNKFSSNYNNLVKDSPSVSSPSHRSLVKEEGPLDIKVKGKYSSDGLNELTNGHKPKLAIGSKKKSEGSHGSAVPNEPSGEVKQRKKLKKEKRHSENVDDELNFEELNDAISRKRLKAQNGREKQGSQTNEADKISKSSDTGHDANLIKAQSSRKNDSRSPNIFDGKVFKRLTSLGRKAEACRPLRVTISPDDTTRSSDEDDIPPTKRLRRASETTYSSALISDKVRSPVMQLAMKRRSVRLCDDEDDDDESQKTPIHGGTTSKVCLVADSKKKPSVHGDDPLVFASKGQVDEKVQSDISPNKVQSLAADVSSAARQLNSEKLLPVEVKSVSVSLKKSPQSIGGSRASAELQSKYSNKGISRKKTPAGDNKSASTSDRSTSFLSKQASFGDKKKATPKSDLQINDSVPVVRTSTENITSVRERLTFGKDEKTSFAVDSKISDSATSMKHLIAAAQAKKRQAHLQNSYGNPFPFSIPDFDLPARDLGPTPTTLAFESSKTLQLDVQGSHPTSPFSNVHQITSINQHENEEIEERRVSSGHRSSLSGGTEAAVARDAFEGMIETLSRTKESIARATRLAIDCAKYGLASEVVELLIQKLENEPSLHRRVDLFFLVDSITQCSHSQKGITGASYVSTVQAALPRLIGAAAPAGSGAQENRRQCHKVLRLWLERKILPESVLRRFLDDIGVVNDDTSIGISLRRPSRSERAIHDPIREMEGMVVDEYGSNTTFQLPGLLSAIVLEDEEEFEDILDTNLSKGVSDTSPSDYTPDAENPSLTPSDRRHCILEDVDGELEMEDVSANQKDERPSFTNGFAFLEPNSDRTLESASNVSSEWLDGSPPLPPGSPPLTPPLPTSPPPSPPPLPSSPPPPLPPPSTHQNPFPQLFVGPPQPPMGPPPPHIGPPRPMGPPPPPPAGPHPPSVGPPPPMGPPPLPCQQLFPPQPPMVSHHMANFQGNQCNPMASNPPSGLSNGGYNSSRPIDYGQGDAYINRQQFLPGSAPFAQRPPPPSHFPYPNSVYPPYNFSDGQRRYDEQWRMQGGRSCSGPPYPHEGYFGPPLERPPANNVNFQPPAPNTMPPASQIPVHGVQMMPGRSDMPAVNWRPA